jgi:hypothetical protein
MAKKVLKSAYYSPFPYPWIRIPNPDPQSHWILIQSRSGSTTLTKTFAFSRHSWCKIRKGVLRSLALIWLKWNHDHCSVPYHVVQTIWWRTVIIFSFSMLTPSNGYRYRYIIPYIWIARVVRLFFRDKLITKGRQLLEFRNKRCKFNDVKDWGH